ncbi:DUF6371 domain-containing protein [Flavobacterium facile]
MQSVITVLHHKHFNICQCLFGLHLIENLFCKTIAIVASEKKQLLL